MKKYYLMATALCGLLVLNGINQVSANNSQVKEGTELYRGYTFLGYLGSVTVNTNSPTYVITVPAPAEQVLGTAPSAQWSVNANYQLVITMDRVALLLAPGEQVNIEVGVRKSDGEIGVYYITLIGR